MGILNLAIEDGLNPKKVASTKGGEYHSACPACGGKDRFIIWDKLNRYMCRQCNTRGDEIQYYRNFHGLTYVEACKESGIVPKKRSTLKMSSHMQETRPVFHFEPRIIEKPPLAWRKQALAFVQYCHEQAKKNPFALELFHKRGLSNETIERFHLGWNPRSLWLERRVWGLGEGQKKLWIPKGLLIPTYDCSTGELIKLKIRRNDWQDSDKLPKYVEISGSMQTFTVYEHSNSKPIVVVESEIDAILLQQCAGDLCCPIALGGASKRPDAQAHRLLVNAPVIIFSLDVDSAGAMAYRWWKEIYPNVKLNPPPMGKSPGDAHVMGIDLREWIAICHYNISQEATQEKA